MLEKRFHGQGQSNELYVKYIPDLENQDSKNQKTSSLKTEIPYNYHNNVVNINRKNNKSNHILSGSDNENDESSLVTYHDLPETIASVKEQIAYDVLLKRYPERKGVIENMINIIVEVLMSESDKIYVAQNTFPAALVKSRFQDLKFAHIIYALECINKSTAGSGNTKNYLMTILFNATGTKDIYYQLKVNHDMPQYVN